MAIINNSPGMHFIYFKGMIITHDNIQYQIQDFYTCKKYIFWESSLPYQLKCTDDRLKELGDRWLIVINDRGVGTIVAKDGLGISFSDSSNSQLITEKITGIYEQNKEFGEKFVTIQTDINGISQTVGTIQEEVGGVKTQLSEFEQTVDGISTSVSKVEKEFNENRDLTELRENVNKSLLALHSTIGAYSQDVNSYMEDSRITQYEKEEIAVYQTKIIVDKTDANNYINIVVSMLEQQGQTDKVTSLTSVRNQLNTSIDNLNSYINTSIVDDMITPSEITTIVSAFGNVTSKINLVKNTIDDFIFLGVGGKLLEEVSKINVTSNQILLSTSIIESNLKNNLNLKKSLIQGVIDSNNTVMSSLKKCFAEIIDDREISQTEKDSLNLRLTTLSSEFQNMTNKYNEIYNDTSLSTTEKTNLKNSYDIFTTAYNQMVSKINSVISDDVVNDIEIQEVNELVEVYSNVLIDLHAKMCLAVDNIESNKTQAEINQVKKDLQKEIIDLDGKVDNMFEDVNEAISSGLIDKQEKANILQNVEVLKREKIDIDNRFNEWYGSIFLYGGIKSNYKNTYDNYISKYTTLVILSNQIANKTDLVTEGERLQLKNSTTDLLISLNLFYTESEKVINTIMRNEIEYTKNNLQKELNDVNSIINNLNTEMKNSFKDGIISELEITNINSLISNLDKEKQDIDKKYNDLYNNPNLT